MKRFLVKVALGAFGAGLLLVGLPVARVVLAQPAQEAAFRLPADTQILFTGDSHIGCGIVERPGVKVLWRSSSSPKFSLLRLRNIDRLGWPEGLRTVVTEVSTQTLYAEHADSLQGPAWETAFFWAWPLPEAWADWRVVVRFLGRLSHFPAVPEPSETPPDMETPITSRTEAEREDELRKAFASHFGRLTAPEQWARAEAELREELRALRAFCEAKGVRLVLFSGPQTSFYRTRMPPWARERFVAFQAWLREEGFDYHDRREALEDVWFRDSHHPRPSGAKRFTERFLRELSAAH